MPASIPAFTVERFEYLEAGPGIVLLRLAGFWSEADPPADTAYLSVTGGDREMVELSALPAPKGGGGAWRAAYSAPARLLDDPLATYELELERGPAILLPAPVRRGPAEPQAPATDDHESGELADEVQGTAAGFFARRREHEQLKSSLAAEREGRREAERAAADERARAERAEASLRAELHDAVERASELLNRIDDYQDSREQFPEETEALRRELEAAKRETATANEQVDVAHEAHALELGAARRQRNAALERQEELERKLAAARAEVEAQAMRLDARGDSLERARAEAAVALEESDELQAATTRLRDAIVARAEADARSGGRMRSADELAVTQEELQDGVDRLAELERQAEALRDAIYAQLPPRPGESPLQEALPMPLEAEEAADEQTRVWN